MKPDIVKTYPFIDQWRSKGYQYFVIPKEMLKYAPQFGIGLDEVILYSILKDRTRLSAKNNWIDPDGRVYVIFTRDEASRYIGWSQRKTIDVFSRLISAGLLSEVNQKSGTVLKKPKKLFLRQWISPSLLRGVKQLKNGGFPCYTVENIHSDAGAYYIIPRVFFDDDILRGLNIRSIMLYAIALDRLHLSIQYGNVDSNGLVWCSLNPDAVMEELGCSRRSLTTSYHELEELGLMVRARGGEAFSGYRIYLRDYLPAGDSRIVPKQADESAKLATAQSLHLDMAEFTAGAGKDCARRAQNLHLDLANSSGGNAQNLLSSKTLNQSDSQILSEVNLGPAGPGQREATANGQREEVFSLLYDQLCYDRIFSDVRQWAPAEDHKLWFTVLNKCIFVMACDLSSSASVFRIGNNSYSKETVQAVYAQIDEFLLITVASKIVDRFEQIRDLNKYIRATLFNAPTKHGGEAYHIRSEIIEARKQQPSS